LQEKTVLRRSYFKTVNFEKIDIDIDIDIEKYIVKVRTKQAEQIFTR
jgi:hypothetical protein